MPHKTDRHHLRANQQALKRLGAPRHRRGQTIALSASPQSGKKGRLERKTDAACMHEIDANAAGEAFPI